MSSSTGPQIPFPEGTEEYGYYERLQNVVRSSFPNMKPRVLVITDIEQDYDDLLAIIFLSEMHRMGAIELAGCVANHHPADKRAKFLRATLDCLNLQDVPVAIGTKGASDISAHAPDLYYGLKNTRFSDHAERNSMPLFKSEDDLISFLADQSGKETTPGELPKQKLTVLLISSLQDISEAFERWKSVPGRSFPTDKFEKFVSQGGYKLEGNKLWPEMGMMNNKFHRQAAKNYTRTLQGCSLQSDAWSREAAKAARLDGSFFQKLFPLGPIGAHLEWVWLRQEFKFYYDPIHDPYMPHLDVAWYLNTRLNLKKDSDMFQKYVKRIPPFKDIIPLIKVIAYDCCAAVGAVGDDFMRAFGILEPDDEIPAYNKDIHRVFGRAVGDMGGINTDELAKVMEVFLLGGLLATKDHAEKLLKTQANTEDPSKPKPDHDTMTYKNTIEDWEHDQKHPLILEAKKRWKELQALKDKQADTQDSLELARSTHQTAQLRDAQQTAKSQERVRLAENTLNEVVGRQTKAEIALNAAIGRIEEDKTRSSDRTLRGEYDANTPELFGAPYELLYQKDVLGIEEAPEKS